MVVDAAIVVLKILIDYAKGLTYHGSCLSWCRKYGCCVCFSLTTVMVFIPILIMELEVGQLFRDIATLSVSFCYLTGFHHRHSCPFNRLLRKTEGKDPPKNGEFPP